jgi:hypothetical protein
MIQSVPTSNSMEAHSQNSNANDFTPVSSLEEFEQMYSVKVDAGIVSVTDLTNKLVRSKLDTKKVDRCIDYGDPTHFHDGIYYFVLSSEKYINAKHVYSYNQNQNSIKCIFSPLTNPHFIKNRLVNFGSGFTSPGPQHYNHSGTGVITVYDLTIQQGKKEIKKIFVKDGSNGGWDGSIENEEIHAFDHVTGEIREYPIFDKV